MALLNTFSVCYFGTCSNREEDVYELEGEKQEIEKGLKTLERITSQKWAKKGKVYKPWSSDFNASLEEDDDSNAKKDKVLHPKEHWLFGFADRKLERKFIEHTARQVFPQSLLAFVTICLL